MTSVPPVTRDGFAFANGDLYAEASGHNRHRRATLAELKTHFDSGSDKDHPAHWFEAQLVHYGLPPSKTKAVARMRLLDAVKAAGSGTLKVPAHVSKLEGELKKEWTKLDREAKKALKAKGGNGSAAASSTSTTTTEKKAGTKRKAEESVDVTVSVGGINITVSKGTAATLSAQSAAKKTKTTAATPTATTPKAATPKTAGATKAVTPKAAASKPPASKAKAPAINFATSSKSVKEKASSSKSNTVTAKPKAKPAQDKKAATSKGKSTAMGSTSSTAAASAQAAPKPRTKQTARKSACHPFSVLDDDYSDDHMRPSQDTAPRGRTKQTARKFSARPVSALSHNYHNDPMDVDDEPPPPYTEYSDTSYSGASHGSPVDLAPLGLLNGRYDIASPFVSGEWPFVGEDFELVLTLAGSSLWGRFDLGIVEGVFRLDQRPYESSNNELSFIWRGREHEGPIMYGNSHRGWIKFLGGGRVEGYLDFQGIEFHGERLPGQSTTSEISAREMDREWNGYSEAVYDMENRARWG
ncbi:hypothetical protein PG996_003577 [Apiospora saccharicola]|uniref:Uncharacterized protein n=1 Tax=Apiospora saccharicola TaxID=335842 RepID=A0ABR1W2W3_9PEZI